MDYFHGNDGREAVSKQQAFIPEGMTIHGDIIVDGDLKFAGNLEGNLSVTGQLDVYGNLKGESIKAGSIAIYKGQFIGDIECVGHMNVPTEAMVIGNINAESLDITGAYQGDVNVKEQFTVGENAVVSGHIKAKNISVANGALCDITVEPNHTDLNLNDFFVKKQAAAKAKKSGK